jgi:hypothetical protein
MELLLDAVIFAGGVEATRRCTEVTHPFFVIRDSYCLEIARAFVLVFAF